MGLVLEAQFLSEEKSPELFEKAKKKFKEKFNETVKRASFRIREQIQKVASKNFDPRGKTSVGCFAFGEKSRCRREKVRAGRLRKERESESQRD